MGTKLVIRNYAGNRLGDGRCIIFCRFTSYGKATYISSGESIDPGHWNPKTGEVKKSYKGHISINKFLQDFQIEIDDIVRSCRLSNDPNDRPTTANVKRKYRELQQLRSAAAIKRTGFFDFMEQFIKESKTNKRPDTVKTYLTTKNHLESYQEDRKIKLDWNTIDLTFYYDFQKYFIEEKGHQNNSFGAVIKVLKVILNSALERKINPCDHFKSRKFAVINTPSDKIYLNESEIDILAKLDLSNNLKLQKVRDLFLLACCTGLRYGDLKSLSADNISGNRLSIKTAKTNTPVIIPLHPLVKWILGREDIKKNGLPEVPSNQKMNDYLKDLGKLAGFNREVIVSAYRGAKVIQEKKKAWELISTHTARRSFATNLHKQGVPSLVIMKLTGHKTEKSFLKYIKVTEDENAELLEEHWNAVYSKSAS